MAVSTNGASRQEFKRAEELFASGRFPDAEPIYRQLCTDDGEDLDTLSRLGHIALLSGHAEEAVEWLSQALALQPKSPYLRTLLADAHYRQGDFPVAARYLHSLERDAFAENLEEFATVAPYSITPVSQPARIEWMAADPLPVIRALVNGYPANLLIDTGTGELIMDKHFAEESGLPMAGYERNAFAGGRTGIVQYGRVEEIRLDGLAVRHVPTQALDVRSLFAPYFPNIRIDGVIGTALLSRTEATLDYRQHTLELATPADATRASTPSQEHAVSVPFWLAGSHHIIAAGNINGRYPSMLFVDSGMTGAAFGASPSTLVAAEIAIDEDEETVGYGGGGGVAATPFELESVCLGGVCRQQITGLRIDRFDLEHAFGFRVGGLVGHDFFRDCRVTLDFKGMKLVIEEGAGSAREL